MTAEFIVHAVPGSPYARAVMATLEEKGAPWRIAPLGPGMSKKEPHLSRHPFGRVPVLEHGSFTLYETQAILRYLDRILPDPALTPASPQDAARMDQLIGINDSYLFPGCATAIVVQRIVGPRLLGLTPDERVIAEAMPRAHLVFREISRLLGDKEWLAGRSLSLADLMAAPQMEFLSRTPEWRELTAGLPNLVSWLGRVEARPSFQATIWERVAELAKAA